MRLSSLLILSTLTLTYSSLVAGGGSASNDASNMVILDQHAIQNLGIEKASATDQTFETTVFSIGRIEEIPANRSALSSRIAGRVIELNAFVGDSVKPGDVLVRVESRQPGDPPPTIELKALQGGTIVDSHARIGEPVEPDSDILYISDRSSLWAVARIPELKAAGIVPGTKARIRIPALGNETIEATLDRFGVEANRKAGAIEGIFVLDNSDGRLQPGMRAEFSIITKQRKNVMAIPRTAIQGDPTQRVVFVEDFELPNAFLRAPVVLGEQNDQFVEVISGLFPGDEVVTKGSYSLSFAGAGSGMSLKEALDAAHGHEHNEDGSEITPEQQAARDAETAPSHESSLPSWAWIALGWAVVATLIALVLGQKLLRARASA